MIQIRQKVVILGAGFAGIRTALDLKKYLGNKIEVILVDEHDYQLYYPALYEVATAVKEDAGAYILKNSVALPIEKIIGQERILFLHGKFGSIDFENKTVKVDDQNVKYDWLVVAGGAKEEYFGIPGAREYAWPLKNLKQAISLRNHIDYLMEKNDRAESAYRFVVAGGGFSATEFVGELRNYLVQLANKNKIDRKKIEIVVVEGADSLLPGLNKKVCQMAEKRLKSFSIKLLFGKKISEVGENFVILDGKEKIMTDTVVWAVGISGCGQALSSSFVDKRGRFAVDNTLRLAQNDHVFILGDINSLVNPNTGKPIPQLAQVAIDEGKYTAWVINRLIKRQSIDPYKPSVYGFIIPVSGKYAIFSSANGEIIIGGFLGWVLRRFADLRYFLSVLPLFYAFKIWMSENLLYIKND